MSDVVLVSNTKTVAANTIEPIYTSPPSGNGTIIKAFTASNDTNVNRSYKAYIFDTTGTLVDAIVPFKIVLRNRFDLAPSAVNQVVPTGGTIRVETSLAASISFYASGTEQT